MVQMHTDVQYILHCLAVYGVSTWIRRSWPSLLLMCQGRSTWLCFSCPRWWHLLQCTGGRPGCTAVPQKVKHRRRIKFSASTTIPTPSTNSWLHHWLGWPRKYCVCVYCVLPLQESNTCSVKRTCHPSQCAIVRPDQRQPTFDLSKPWAKGSTGRLNRAWCIRIHNDDNHRCHSVLETPGRWLVFSDLCSICRRVLKETPSTIFADGMPVEKSSAVCLCKVCLRFLHEPKPKGLSNDVLSCMVSSKSLCSAYCDLIWLRAKSSSRPKRHYR